MALAKCVLHWTGMGEEGTLTWWIDGITSGHTAAQMSAAATEWDNQLSTGTSPSGYSKLAGYLWAAQTIDRLAVYEYDSPIGTAVVSGLKTVSHPGTGAVAAGDLATCLVVTTETGFSGRRYRGRQYWPGNVKALVNVASGLVTNTVCDTLAQDAVNLATLAEQMCANSLGAATPRWSVVSRRGAFSNPVVTAVVDNRPDTQRRRMAQLKPTYHGSQPH